MFITVEAAMVIQAPPEAIWQYAIDPAHWTASNPEEHLGLVYHNASNRPGPGVEFLQRERVSGITANLHGRFLVWEPPHLAVWVGLASYRLLWGGLTLRIPEGGVLRLEPVDAGVCFSHDVYMQFAESWLAAFWQWLFLHARDGRGAIARHAQRELEYFKHMAEHGMMG